MLFWVKSILNFKKWAKNARKLQILKLNRFQIPFYFTEFEIKYLEIQSTTYFFPKYNPQTSLKSYKTSSLIFHFDFLAFFVKNVKVEFICQLLQFSAFFEFMSTKTLYKHVMKCKIRYGA